MITAPFNFVPLSDKVFYPNWSEQISHDIPFEDGESGIIDITITAKSPIFIQNHQNPKQFCNYKGDYYIPSSSVKGMVRNVLEIMSFSKMSQFNDDTYAVRDLRNRELYMSKMTSDNTFCGFLKKVDGEYFIEDCGKPGRIKHEEIEKIYNMNFASKFKHGNFGNKAKDKTAKVKYDMINSNEFEHNFSYFKKDVNREIYRYHENGKNRGTLVLTGQPSARKEPQGRKPSGKVYEFIFFASKSDIKLNVEFDKKLEKEIIPTLENFKFAYFDKRTTEPKESHDWTFWKKRLEDGKKVPVFFQKSGNQIAHFGLSYLYKLPYKNSVKDGIPKIHSDNRLDMAQRIFGYISKEGALKGRVQFSHFKANSKVQELSKRTEILGTPRASYYPIYVKQQNENLYTTFMDSNFEISGRKRYPIHKGNSVTQTDTTGNENVGTTFIPLKDGVIFQGKLRYHNLKKYELGAILSALTFHNTEGCFHNIGMAKSLGYGKIDIKLGIKDINNYLKAFELEITSQIQTWTKNEQLKELLSMATEQNNSGDSELKYMDLPDFAKNKTGDKDYLRNYTELNNIITVTPQSLLLENDLNSLKARQKEEIKAENLRQEQKEKNLKLQNDLEKILNTDNIQILQNFIDKYPNYQKINEIISKKEKIELSNNQNRYKEVDEKAKYSYEALQKKKSNLKIYKKELNKFVKKWEASKNNKGSKFVLELVEKIKKEKK